MQHQDIKAKRNNLPTPPLRILFLWICPWKWQVEFYVWYILTLCLESNYLVNKKKLCVLKNKKNGQLMFYGGPLILRIQSIQPSLLRGLLLFSKSAKTTLWESYSNCNYTVIGRLWFWNLFDTISHTMRGPPVYLYYIHSCFYIKDIHI